MSNLELGTKSLICASEKEVDNSEPLTYCVQALLAIVVMLRPSADTNQLANQLRLLQRIKVVFLNILSESITLHKFC